MRARTIREGSVGLLILLGIGLFGGLVLWLRGFNPTNRPYRLLAEFDNATGVQLGTPVLYRGVPVGRVASIAPLSNGVEVGLEITQKDLRMPNDVRVETVESGLIGEMSIEITPLVRLATSAAEISPTAEDCNSEVILCAGDRLMGITGPSYEELLRSATEVADLLADPELIAQLKATLENISQTTSNAGELAQAATALTQQAQAEIGPLSESAQAAVNSATRTARQFEGTAQQFSLTATDINSLIGENRGTLVDTLGNVQAASVQLRTAADTLGPTFQNGELVRNLEALVSNAAAATTDLQAVTASLNTPANLVLLQQTLESARDALASAQKVMADVDEITGDPAVREQLRNLINGLGDLVSSTQSLEQQSEVARVLAPFGQTAAQTADQTAANRESRPASSGPVADVARTNSDQPANQLVLVFDGERYILKQQVAEGVRPGVDSRRNKGVARD
ncbi:MlaD family protein [Leptolyngbya sp. BC1307]|uniref:MlaD family protein n=1 Tax=Leptolyngbya sp. BC1307 TaxID=2029589 RepID=UPI000EFB5E7A|nr:MlaD family protein [Leptolyngbya sp. BC1307]